MLDNVLGPDIYLFLFYAYVYDSVNRVKVISGLRGKLIFFVQLVSIFKEVESYS